jgi:predicted alpha/beta-fold hydrolase
VLRNPSIAVALTDHGGHCGFVQERSGTYDGYWAEREIVDFLLQHCHQPSGPA